MAVRAEAPSREAGWPSCARVGRSFLHRNLTAALCVPGPGLGREMRRQSHRGPHPYRAQGITTKTTGKSHRNRSTTRKRGACSKEPHSMSDQKGREAGRSPGGDCGEPQRGGVRVRRGPSGPGEESACVRGGVVEPCPGTPRRHLFRPPMAPPPLSPGALSRFC